MSVDTVSFSESLELVDAEIERKLQWLAELIRKDGLCGVVIKPRARAKLIPAASAYRLIVDVSVLVVVVVVGSRCCGRKFRTGNRSCPDMIFSAQNVFETFWKMQHHAAAQIDTAEYN